MVFDAGNRIRFRYLARADVVFAAEHVDPIDILRKALLLHADGRTILPAEAQMYWRTGEGEVARSLALPGAVWDARPAIGVKLINSSLSNTIHGMLRAQGFVVIFDADTAYPTAIMEAAYLSALRTASYSALSVRCLCRDRVRRMAVIGCGAMGEAHVQLMSAEQPGATFALYDEIPGRRDDLAAALADEGLSCVGAKTVAEAVDGAEVIFTVTTATSSYLSYSWISPGALIAHVSLDDVEPEVVRRADLLLVDDFELVSNDQRRLLGRMFHAGELLGPGGECADKTMPGARRIDGTLADVLRGKLDRRSRQGVVLSNPFGMGILDVAIAAQIVRVSESLGLGVMLDF